MALDLGALESGLEEVAADPPATHALCAKAWASAVGEYAKSVVPASSSVEAAVAALEARLATAFATTNAAGEMEIAMAVFALGVASGMAGFAPTPPPGLVGFAAQFATHPETHADAAEAVAELIDTWMRTGTATPSGGGAPISWS